MVYAMGSPGDDEFDLLPSGKVIEFFNYATE